MGLLDGINELNNTTPITTKWLRQNNWVVNYYDVVNDTWRKSKITYYNIVGDDDKGLIIHPVFELLYCITTQILTIRVLNITNDDIRKHFSSKVYSLKNFNSLIELEMLLEDETLINIFKKNEPED